MLYTIERTANIFGFSALKLYQSIKIIKNFMYFVKYNRQDHACKEMLNISTLVTFRFNITDAKYQSIGVIIRFY